ncbi:hypothetical protein EW026_g4255 [Hermanssonia centrifuga]|uniref:Uncharacterized protein n=1 Tax=Hermanssonia centrifuga TaxID=98765 RepID=A0A4S4KIN7_9APHY|nr:hypothetical protein EW026_g4255 [Hermanssonia centrifuga]
MDDKHFESNIRYVAAVTQLVQEPIVDGNRFLPFEEDDAALDEKNDTEMLAAVDTILLDDDLLRTTMWETLQQTIPAPSDAIKFVSQAIERRLQQNVLSAVSTSIPDLRLLSKRGWGAIVDIVADTLNKNYDFRSILPSWMEDALIILLSFNDFPLTSNGNRALSLWISSEAHAYTSRIIASHTSDYKSFTHVLRRMRSAFTLCTSEDVVTCLHYILRDRIADGDQDIAFSDILRTKPEVPEDTVHSVLLILLDVAMRRLPDDTSPWTVGVQRALNAILSTPVPTCTRPEISLLLSKLMQRETLAIGLMTEIAATTPQYQAFHAEACHNLEHAYIDNDFTGRKLILAGQISMIKAYNDGLYDDPKYLPISFIQLCHVYLCILDEAQKNDAFDAGLRSDWRELWIHMAIAARRFKLRDGDANEHANFAEICLYSLQDLDDRISLKPSNANVVRDEMGDSEWLEGFTLEDSLFNDDLFDALSIFLPDEAAVKFKRVKHLRDLRTFIQADASLSQEISGSSMNDDEVGPEAGQIMDGENGGGMTDAGFGYGD